MLRHCKINKQILRRLSSTQHPECKEFQIPVPWGHIAAKWWGPQNKRPILTLHGWQDNCGSFDQLIPYLNKSISFLAIDFPGHGFSSNLPNGISYEWMDYILAVRRIVKYFDWSKVTLMGHSLGATVSYVYTILYPDTIDFVIAIEGLKPLVFKRSQFKHMGEHIDKIIEYDEINRSGSKPPSLSIQELEKKMQSNTAGLERFQDILQRNIRPSDKEPNKFYFQRDLRVKILPTLNFSEEAILESTKEFKCPALLCLGNHEDPYFRILLDSQTFYESIKKVNENFKIHSVVGNHYVHVNNPKLLEGVINDFLKKYNN